MAITKSLLICNVRAIHTLASEFPPINIWFVSFEIVFVVIHEAVPASRRNFVTLVRLSWWKITEEVFFQKENEFFSNRFKKKRTCRRIIVAFWTKCLLPQIKLFEENSQVREKEPKKSHLEFYISFWKLETAIFHSTFSK